VFGPKIVIENPRISYGYPKSRILVQSFIREVMSSNLHHHMFKDLPKVFSLPGDVEPQRFKAKKFWKLF